MVGKQSGPLGKPVPAAHSGKIRGSQHRLLGRTLHDDGAIGDQSWDHVATQKCHRTVVRAVDERNASGTTLRDNGLAQFDPTECRKWLNDVSADRKGNTIVEPLAVAGTSSVAGFMMGNVGFILPLTHFPSMKSSSSLNRPEMLIIFRFTVIC